MYPSTHGSDNKVITIKFIKLDFFLLQCVSSLTHAIIFSNTASTVENAANVINTKNKLPHILPNGILLKIFGSVIKTKLGP